LSNYSDKFKTNIINSIITSKLLIKYDNYLKLTSTTDFDTNLIKLYFLNKEIVMMISTISIAEYCVRGDVHELPLKNLQIIPFNLNHAKRTGEFAGFVFDHKKSLDLKNRNIIPNDSKLFAQADTIQSVDYYLSSDVEILNIYNLLKANFNPSFHFLNLNNSYQQSFGLLDL
jgi:hypothetical protein